MAKRLQIDIVATIVPESDEGENPKHSCVANRLFMNINFSGEPLSSKIKQR